MVYLRQYPKLPAGYLASTQVDIHVDSSFLNELVTAQVLFGAGLCLSGYNASFQKIALLPVLTTDVFYGVIIDNPTGYRPKDPYGVTVNYQFGQALVLVVTRGIVTVNTSTAVAINDPVYLDTGSVTAANKGTFNNSNTGSTSITIPSSRAKWHSTLSAAGVAELELF